jgi:dipeptidyl-peptidase-4
VWGWSGGGTDTLRRDDRLDGVRGGHLGRACDRLALLRHEVHRDVHEDAAGQPDGYTLFNLAPRAKDLHGRLMLVFGSGDDNVHPQNSWAFIDQLIAADKPFDLMVYPLRKHTIDDRPARIHLFEKMLEFWKLNL